MLLSWVVLSSITQWGEALSLPLSKGWVGTTPRPYLPVLFTPVLTQVLAWSCAAHVTAILERPLLQCALRKVGGFLKFQNSACSTWSIFLGLGRETDEKRGCPKMEQFEVDPVRREKSEKFGPKMLRPGECRAEIHSHSTGGFSKGHNFVIFPACLFSSLTSWGNLKSPQVSCVLAEEVLVLKWVQEAERF